MRVLQINTVYAHGSTGNIAKAIHDICSEHEVECVSACRYIGKEQGSPEDVIEISSKWDSRLHGWWSRFTMLKGTGSICKTRRFLKKVRQYSPDIIHLHNLHGSYINLPMLFRFIKTHDIPVVWTLHDCWAFTAICSHFTIAQCDKWKTGCHHCSERKRFSSSPFDLTKSVWKAKKKWFNDVRRLTVVTPSDWLSDLVKQSFLGDYAVVTIHNGIDLQLFTETASDFRKKYGLENKKIVLGVAFDWGYHKGLDVFTALSKRLPDNYQIILVGTNDEIDDHLPKNILSIHRTNNQSELARIYATADVFVNPTREDTFPTVNLEALACGTPIVTFQTGGSPECLDPSCGVVVEVDRIDHLEREIIRICTQMPFHKVNCRRHAELFDKKQQLEEYIALYKRMVSESMS